MFFRIVSFATCILLPLISASQDTASHQINTKSTTLGKFKLSGDSYEQVDTGIDLIQQYNPAYKIENFNEGLGNYGTPLISTKFDPFSRVEFRSGLHHYNAYQYTPSDIGYFDTYTPFTDLSFDQWTNGNFLDLSGVYTRNISPFWNAAIRFNTMRSKGTYLRQQTKQNKIGINTRFSSESGRYKGFLSGIWNSFEQQENGGLSSVKEFKELEEGDRTRLSIKLEDAKENYKTKYFTYDHFLFLGPKHVDTVYKESDTFRKKEVREDLYFRHQFGYSEESYAFNDENPTNDGGFYPAIFNDSSKTHDTFFHGQLSNEISISNFRKPDSSGNQFGFRAGVDWNISRLYQGGNSSGFMNVLLKGGLDIPLGKHSLISEGKFVSFGKYQGDFKLDDAYRISVDSAEFLEFGHKIQSRKPDHLYSELSSNHLQWDNDFGKTVVNRFYTGYENDKMGLNAKAFYTILHNYVYLNNDLDPQQHSEPINSFSAEISQHFEVGPFNFRNHFLYQYLSNETVIRLPVWSVRSSLYYKNQFFEDNLLMATGIDFRYNEAYMGNAYFPAYNLYYLQNDRTISGYPVIDLFLNFRIERFRGFIKLAHINKGVSGNDYFFVPEYPLYPRVLTVGVKWMFFN